MACYKTVRGWISGQSLLVLDFVAYPPGGGGWGFSVTVSPTSITVIYRPFDFGLIQVFFVTSPLDHPITLLSSPDSLEWWLTFKLSFRRNFKQPYSPRIVE